MIQYNPLHRHHHGNRRVYYLSFLPPVSGADVYGGTRECMTVDVDQYYSIPEVGPVLLTSCIKLLQSTVFGILRAYYNDTFYGGQVLKCDLKRGGVWMAPYHDYEASIPDSIKMALDSIMTGIQKGKISTGWN